MMHRHRRTTLQRLLRSFSRRGGGNARQVQLHVTNDDRLRCRISGQNIGAMTPNMLTGVVWIPHARLPNNARRGAGRRPLVQVRVKKLGLMHIRVQPQRWISSPVILPSTTRQTLDLVGTALRRLFGIEGSVFRNSQRKGTAKAVSITVQAVLPPVSATRSVRLH